jgi:hypothetical protein
VVDEGAGILQAVVDDPKHGQQGIDAHLRRVDAAQGGIGSMVQAAVIALAVVKRVFIFRKSKELKRSAD